jgi:hypothetical protein
VVSVVEGVRGATTYTGNKETGKAPQFISLQTIKLTDTTFPSSEYKIVIFLETISV